MPPTSPPPTSPQPDRVPPPPLTPPSGPDTEHGVTGVVRGWLRLEGLAVLVLATAVFAHGGHSWPLYAILFLVPDLSFLGYLAGPRVGAWAYNVAHSYVGPIAIALILAATGRPPVIACIWAAHLGFDRMLGYGLKYPSAFQHTHLGRIGRRRLTDG